VADEFAALSLPDLLDARDQYHVHLIRQRNVLATAVGRYLVRKGDARTTFDERLEQAPGTKDPRTLENSSVRPWSWPCVLVFVDHWMTAEEIERSPDEMVPRRLYLPDGRVVPTCVVYAPAAAPAPRGIGAAPLSFSSSLLGGGYVCLTDVQGEERVGSIACLVTDGIRVYALTNRHVAGEHGQEVTTVVRGTEVPVGRSVGRSAGREAFVKVYPGFAGGRAELAIDAGLVEVADVRDWTAQVFGVGELDDLMDLGPETLSLTLVGKPVRAFGGASGKLEAEITALYYRYRTRSGVEQLADAIVGPREDDPPLQTRPGDSGTLWVIDEDVDPPPPKATPIALQWGGHRFATDDGEGASPYALVTFLSTVCSALDVEPIYDLNTSQELYWGEVGHYTIGALACELVRPPGLRDFFLANQRRISFDRDAIVDGRYKTGADALFHPLADVPDTVWKFKKTGWIRQRESPNHFADMDDPLPNGDTLLSMFEADHLSVNPTDWLAFYAARGIGKQHMGLLPFRVAQLYSVCVDSFEDGDVTQALAAAGVMAHYVGDACQPLHTSRLHDGRTAEEKGVHSAYETAMVEGSRDELIAALDAAIDDANPVPLVEGHRAAARAVVELMKRSIERLPPETILDAWVAAKRDDVRGNAKQLWVAVGDETIECMVDGCATLAMLWSSAWNESGAPEPAAKAVSRTALRDLYMNPAFAPSGYLADRIAGW
jgi:hypothetical protein